MADATNIYAGVAGYFGKPDHPGKFGVFQRAAKGGDWKHVLANAEAYTVFVHPNNPEIVFAGTNDGVWRSTDRGATFKQVPFPDAKKQIWCFMVDSRDPKKMLAGGSPIDVYRSDDTGVSWRKLPTPKMPAHCKGPFASRVMRFAQNPKKPKFETVAEKKILTDGTHTIELYHLTDFGHNDGMLIAYLPKEKVLLEADGFNPPAQPAARPPATISPYTASLAANIQRLNLDVQRIIPVHYPADNRKVMNKELLVAVGKSN